MIADFFVTLPSNVSMHVYPNNNVESLQDGLTSSHKSVRRVGMRFDRDTGPALFVHVQDEDTSFFISHANSDFRSRGTIAPGYYDRPNTLIRAINRAINDIWFIYKKKLSYSDITQKAILHVTANTAFATQGSMSAILGLSAPTIISLDSRSNDTYPFVKTPYSVMNISQGFESLYAYTNIVEPHVVGDSLVPQLRIVPMKGDHRQTMSNIFNNIQHFPLLRTEFRTIEIAIRDGSGRAAPFVRGKVMVILHFRRRRYVLI